MIALLFSPLGRYIVLGGVALLTLMTAYFWIRADAVSDHEARATRDVLERVEGAVRSGESVDISPERLRDDDGHRRD